ncbi:MAG: YkgJ family cysteine cluster protein, partial [Planctomycetota bacterium]
MPAEGKSPWYASGLRFECTQCGGCCGGFPGFVWVSEDEADAIARHLGVSRAEFLEQYCLRAGKRVTLREVGDYDCIMLEEDGCR